MSSNNASFLPTSNTMSSSSNQSSKDDLLFIDGSWDYNTEAVFIYMLGILSLPANLFLIFFYIQKMRRYKRFKQLNARYARVANSFHTYMIEMCVFDTIIGCSTRRFSCSIT